MDRRLSLYAVLGIHLVVAVGHGVSHGQLGVALPAWQNALVALTTFIGPVAGAVLVRRRHPWGAPLFAVSMAGALTIGGVLHFLVENPDHIAMLPAGAWRRPFQASAVGVLLTPAAGALVGAWNWAAE